MMTTQFFSETAMNTAIQITQEQPISAQTATFIADDLLPLLSSFFPKSAAHINANVNGHALSYSMMIKGFSVGLVKDVIARLATEDPERLAPTPQALRRECLIASGQAADIKRSGNVVSIRAIEMQAEAAAFTGEISAASIQSFIESRVRYYKQSGFEITGASC